MARHQLFCAAACFFIFSTCWPNAETHSIILGIIDNHTLRVEQYDPAELTGTLSQAIRDQHALFTLNIANSDCVINNISYDNTVKNLFKISHQEITDEHSFLFMWGPALGINIADYETSPITITPWQHHEITSNNFHGDQTVSKLVFTINGKTSEQTIYFDHLIESICGIVVAGSINTFPVKTDNSITLEEAIGLGILIPSNTMNQQDKNINIDQEAEFDLILDVMSQDGLIKIQPVSPLVAWLRCIGGSLLVKYLTIKKYLRALFHRLFQCEEYAPDEVTIIKPPAPLDMDREQNNETN